MPYTVDKVYERSNPIPMVDDQDPDIAKLQAIGDRIISDEVKSDWINALKDLVGFRRNDPDPIRRDYCTSDSEAKNILFRLYTLVSKSTDIVLCRNIPYAL